MTPSDLVQYPPLECGQDPRIGRDLALGRAVSCGTGDREGVPLVGLL